MKEAKAGRRRRKRRRNSDMDKTDHILVDLHNIAKCRHLGTCSVVNY
jgi:hypothetical protein